MAEAGKRNDHSPAALGNEPLGRLMTRLAIPAIAAQIATLLYNIVDRIFLGHIPGYGAEALAGLGICLPIITAISSLVLFAAGGGSPLAAMELGAGNPDRARRVMANAQTLLAIFTVASMVICYAFMPQMLALSGGTETTAAYAADYLRIYLIGTVFVMISAGMSLFLLAQGKATQVLIATAIGAVVHIALAALFIIVLDWGIQGAAASSVVSQAVCAAFVVMYLRRPDSVLRFEFKLRRLDGSLVRRTLSVGSGRFFMAISESLMLIVLNTTLLRYGGFLYVSAMTILYSVGSMFYTIVMGFTQGTQPIISYNYGAGNIVRTRQAIRRIVIISIIATFALAQIAFVFPYACVGLFTSDADLVALSVHYIPVFFVGIMIFGVQLGMQTVFMGLGRGMCSLSVALVRKIVAYVPLIIVLGSMMGPDGVFLSEPISDVISITYCAILFACTIPKMLRKAEQGAGARQNEAANGGRAEMPSAQQGDDADCSGEGAAS